MDTIEQAPAGVEDITPSEDTATDNTQPVETGEVTGTEPEEAGEAEAPLLAGKYKSAEELEKAYQEVQQLNGQLSQKAALANLLEKQTGMNAQQIQELIAQQEQARLKERYANDPTAPLYDKVSALEAELQQQKAEKALDGVKKEIDTFLKSEPGYEAHKEQILKLSLTPGIGYDPATGQEVPVSDIANEYFGKARAQGQQDAYKKIDTKVMTQSSGVKSAPQKRFSIEDMRNMSAAEMRAILPHAPSE